MKTIKNILKTVFASSLLLLASCSDDNNTPEQINEGEIVTKVEIILTNSNNAEDVVTLTSEVHEGETTPEITVDGEFTNGSTYNGDIQFFGEHSHDDEDEDEDGHDDEEEAENITEEILNEANDHEIFYSLSNQIITISKTDVDSNQNPLGLKTTFTPTATGNTELTISLIHEPKKPNNDTLADAAGETDVEIKFNVEVIAAQ